MFNETKYNSSKNNDSNFTDIFDSTPEIDYDSDEDIIKAAKICFDLAICRKNSTSSMKFFLHFYVKMLVLERFRCLNTALFNYPL